MLYRVRKVAKGLTLSDDETEDSTAIKKQKTLLNKETQEDDHATKELEEAEKQAKIDKLWAELKDNKVRIIFDLLVK
jgi:hypothetical protein